MLIEKLRDAFKRRDITRLKEISNIAIEQAAMNEDKELVDLSLIAYALYKLLSKQHFKKKKEWKHFLADVETDLDEAVKMSREGMSLHGILEEDIIRDISEIDESYGNYVKDILHKARIKQASRVYALGMSLQKAIELTGADRLEVYNYIGTTRIHDRPFTSTKDVIKRFRYLKKIFEGQ
ncbi:MAG: hypothetical protein J7K68_05590 [Candidatus Diapherotrites archaeon]|nr:hypothetical protein [Candidatus Diapherotrites archaeon]